jgi:hypothetical protein
MLSLRRSKGLDLVVIDTLATFQPGGNENSPGVMMDCLFPLGALKAEGVGVLLVHHPRKGPSPFGQADRGSGALPAYVDIVINQGWVGPPEDDQDRRRWLKALSRYQQTRKQAMLELTADGTDYVYRGTMPDAQSAVCWEILRLVLQDVNTRVTQREILEHWPEDFVKPDVGTVSRTLKRAVAEGRVAQQGTGRKNDPYRYWLPERAVDFFPGIDASHEALARWEKRWQEKFWERIGMPARQGAGTDPAEEPAHLSNEAAVQAAALAKKLTSEQPKQPSKPDAPAAPPCPALTCPPIALPPAIVSPADPETEPEMAPPPRSIADGIHAARVELKDLKEERRRLRRWPQG